MVLINDIDYIKYVLLSGNLFDAVINSYKQSNH